MIPRSERLNRESKNHICDRRTYECKIFVKQNPKIFLLAYLGSDLEGEYGPMKGEQGGEHLNRDSEAVYGSGQLSVIKFL